jgi:hypothetical protein
MPQVKCVSCGAANDTERAGGYCEECGKRLPTSTSAIRADSPGRPDDPDQGSVSSEPMRDERRRRSPRWSEYDDYPDVSRRGARSDAQKTAARGVAGILFALAAIQLVCNSIALFAIGNAGNNSPEMVAVLIGVILALAGLFAGLGVWALYMPVPAGIVGLIVYVGISLLNIAATVGQGGARGGVGRIIIPVIISVALIRAISAAAKAK